MSRKSILTKLKMRIKKSESREWHESTGSTTVLASLLNQTVVLNLILLALLVSLVVMYIAQMNVALTKGYQIKLVEQSIEELQLSNEALELNVTQAQSVGHIQDQVKMLGMVPVERVEYVVGGTSSVAILR